MADSSKESLSADRRRFFRQILFSAIDTAEKVGKNLVERHGIAAPEPPAFDWDHYWGQQSTEAYGPPWPPPAGPPVPLELMREMQAERREAVARGDYSYHDDPEGIHDADPVIYDADHPDYDPRHDTDEDFHIHGAEPDGDADESRPHP